jgi:non-specific protein-tyrosine kinase
MVDSLSESGDVVEGRLGMNESNEAETINTMVDIKEYFYLLWSWIWLILLAGVVAGAAAYLVSIRTTPIYQSSTRLLVSEPPALNNINVGGMVDSQNMTNTYAQMLVDDPVLQGVITQLKLKTTTDALKQSITVDIVTNTQLLVVSASDPNPTQAANIANAMASVFTDRILQLQSDRYAASLDGLQKQISDMDLQITTTNTTIATTSDPATLLQLQARLTQYRSIYASLVTNYEQVRLAEEQTSTSVVVSQPAAVPTTPVSPKTSRNTLLAIVAGMLLAVGSVFAIDMLDDTIKNPEEIRRKFNLPILGMIAWHEQLHEKPIVLLEPRSPTAEAFRSLRTNITFASVDTPLRRIMITSPTPQDGKTTISANLAVVLAQGEKKVVLLDADLRRPYIHHKFGLFNRFGLTNLFVDSLNGFESVMQFNSVSNLGLITSGPLPPNPAELLTSKKMVQILDLLNKEYDLVLIDTPPLLSVTDASALAPAMDAVIMVVKPGVTKLSALQQALEQLRAVGAHVLGIVLNEVNPSSRKYGYYYNRYYSKYSHYYEHEGGSKQKRTKETADSKPVQEKRPQVKEERK